MSLDNALKQGYQSFNLTQHLQSRRKSFANQQNEPEQISCVGVSFLDNATGNHPDVDTEIQKAVKRGFWPYHNFRDPTQKIALQLVQEHFGSHVRCFWATSGSLGNNLLLKSRIANRSSRYLLVPNNSHILTKEGNSFCVINNSTIKNLKIPAHEFTADVVHEFLVREHESASSHSAEIGAISITNTTEDGQVLDLSQIRELSKLCKVLGIPLHVDGARLFIAAAETGLSLAELVTDLGIDFCTVGMDKAVGGEGVLLVCSGIDEHGNPIEGNFNEFLHLLKDQGAHPPCIWRYAASTVALLNESKGIEIARKTLGLAKYFHEKLEAMQVEHEHNTNHIWFELTHEQYLFLTQEKGHRFYENYRTGKMRIRLTLHGNLDKEKIDHFLRDLQTALEL